uniref:RING-type domain-containing protein n=1 Tax=Chrysemys picta bellii TaxID=8478 RepID=A0A8C3FMY2_CHRPI
MASWNPSSRSGAIQGTGMQSGGSGEMERLWEDVTCSICLNGLDDPVSIECGHNFCQGCLMAHWHWVLAHGYRCPECRAPCSRDRMTPDTQLKALVEKIIAPVREEMELVRPDRPDQRKGPCPYRGAGYLGPSSSHGPSPSVPPPAMAPPPAPQPSPSNHGNTPCLPWPHCLPQVPAPTPSEPPTQPHSLVTSAWSPPTGGCRCVRDGPRGRGPGGF